MAFGLEHSACHRAFGICECIYGWTSVYEGPPRPCSVLGLSPSYCCLSHTLSHPSYPLPHHHDQRFKPNRFGEDKLKDSGNRDNIEETEEVHGETEGFTLEKQARRNIGIRIPACSAITFQPRYWAISFCLILYNAFFTLCALPCVHCIFYMYILIHSLRN